MQKRWTALALAALMLLTASCARHGSPSESSSDSSQGKVWPVPEQSLNQEEPEPVKEPPKWEEGRTLEDLPDDYGGLELPVQGATGYAPVELALWRDPLTGGYGL